MKSKSTVIWLILLAIALLTVASFFLPYASVNKERRERIERYPDAMYAAEINMTNSDAADLSLFEYFRLYLYSAKHLSGNYQGVSILCVVLLSLMAVNVLLILLFVILRKAVPCIVFSILNSGVFAVFSWDMVDRGVIDGSKYSFSITFYLMILLMALIFAGAIVAIVFKKKEKKEQTIIQTPYAWQ